MSVIIPWLSLSVLMRLTLDRLTVFDYFPYEVTRSLRAGLLVSGISLFVVLLDSWRATMITWLATYIIAWCLDSRSPAALWEIRRSLR